MFQRCGRADGVFHRLVGALDDIARLNAGWVRNSRPARRRRLKCLGQPVEPIALAGNGDDKTWLFGIDLDLAPQSPDDHVDAAVERLEAPARHRLEQRVATEDAPGMAHEEAQQREFAARERDCLPGFAGKREGVEVEDEARETHEARRFARRLYLVRFRFVAHGRYPQSSTRSY